MPLALLMQPIEPVLSYAEQLAVEPK